MYAMGREVCGWRGGLWWPAVIVASILAAGLAGSAFAQTQGEEAATTTPSSDISVLVLNGTHRVGLASQVSRELASRGFSTRHLHDRWIANAPRPTQNTTIFIDRRQSGASAAALRLRRLVDGGAELKVMPREIRRYAERALAPMTVLVLGSSFRGIR